MALSGAHTCIVNLIAAHQVANHKAISGKGLRATLEDMGIPWSEMHALIDFCVSPVERIPPNDRYTLALWGWLFSEQEPRVRAILGAGLSLLRDKFKENPDFVGYSADDLRPRLPATEVAEPDFVRNVLAAAYIGDRQDRWGWVTPPDIEALRRLKDVEALLQYRWTRETSSRLQLARQQRRFHYGFDPFDESADAAIDALAHMADGIDDRGAQGSTVPSPDLGSEARLLLKLLESRPGTLFVAAGIVNENPHGFEALAALGSREIDQLLHGLADEGEIDRVHGQLVTMYRSRPLAARAAARTTPSTPATPNHANPSDAPPSAQVAATPDLRRGQESPLIKILFLGANPSNTTHLALTKEVQEIKRHLRSSEYGRHFQVEQEWAVQLSDLNAALLRHRPTIVHFSGHGSRSGELVLETETGKAITVKPDALANLFRILKGSIRCVVLNACYSTAQAEAIAQHIECVVGMTTAVGDKGAIDFAWAFYEALGFDVSVQQAFDVACNQIDFSRLPDRDTPKLARQPGVAPQDVYVLRPRAGSPPRP